MEFSQLCILFLMMLFLHLLNRKEARQDMQYIEEKINNVNKDLKYIKRRLRELEFKK